MSSICHCTLNKLAEKMEDKTWTKIGLDNFPICHLVTLCLDKSWTISGLLKGQSLSSFCSNDSSPTYVKLLSKPRNVPSAHCPRSTLPLPSDHSPLKILIENNAPPFLFFRPKTEHQTMPIQQCNQILLNTAALSEARTTLPESSSWPLPANMAHSRNLAHASPETAVISLHQYH